jgi:hypothetical protein
MITVKLPINLTEEQKTVLYEYQRQQSIVIRYSYNRFLDGKNLKEIEQLIKGLNNIETIDSWFIRSGVYKAKEIFLTGKRHIVFRKAAWYERVFNKVTKEDYKKRKLLNLLSVGEFNYYGNRKFALCIKENKVVCKLNRKTHFDIILPKLRKNYLNYLIKLEEQCNEKKMPFQVEINDKYIHISFEESLLAEKIYYHKKENRIMSLDLNPNYIGYSIVDWKTEANYKIVNTGVLSLEELNSKEFELKQLKYELKKQGFDGSERTALIKNKLKSSSNKRKFEVVEICKRLVNTAKSHNVETFSIEKLVMPSKENHKGKKFNRLVNNLWCRNLLVSNLKKRFKVFDMGVQEVQSQYSSFIGNLIYKKHQLPDMINASLEINRRTFCFIKMYIKKEVPIKKGAIVFPDWETNKDTACGSMEEETGCVFSGWKKLYSYFKNLKLKYRVSLEEIPHRVFRLNHGKAYTNYYVFNNNLVSV